MNKKDKSEKIMRQVKREKRARRQVEIELQLPKEHSHVHKTAKKDKAEKQSNTIREWEDEQ